MDALSPDAMRSLVEDLIPFNRFLGVRLESVDREAGHLDTRLELRPEFVGNALRDMPHGGVVSALIDATAGAAAALSLEDLSLADRVATIDMRVDYLRPAPEADLVATATVSLLGNRVGNAHVLVHAATDLEHAVAEGRGVYNIRRQRKS